MPLNIFAFLPRASGEGQELLKAVAPLVAGGRLEVYHDLEGFAAGSAGPRTRPPWPSSGTRPGRTSGGSPP